MPRPEERGRGIIWSSSTLRYTAATTASVLYDVCAGAYCQLEYAWCENGSYVVARINCSDADYVNSKMDAAHGKHDFQNRLKRFSNVALV